MVRQSQFKAREVLILNVAEQLMLENGDDTTMTLDGLAAALDLAKGTLYKHFKSKDELYMLLILRNEQQLLDLMLHDAGQDFSIQLEHLMQYHFKHPERTILFHLLEEKLSMAAKRIQPRFSQLYRIRKQRLKMMVYLTDEYLKQQQSRISVRDYLAAVWALIYGGSLLLNSSFYQRYLGSRTTLKRLYVQQALCLSKNT